MSQFKMPKFKVPYKEALTKDFEEKKFENEQKLKQNEKNRPMRKKQTIEAFEMPELKLPNTPLTKDLTKDLKKIQEDKKAIANRKKAMLEAEKSRFHNNNNDGKKLLISFATSIAITLTCAVVGCNFLFFTKLDADSLEAIFPISSRYYNILEDPKTNPTEISTTQETTAAIKNVAVVGGGGRDWRQ